MSKTIEPGNNAGMESPQAKRKRTTAMKAKGAKKASRAKRAAGKPQADRSNKKAEVIAMMKRAKGATLAEIIKLTGWQQHKTADGERTYKIAK